MISGTELSAYCSRLEKLGYEIGHRSISEEQIEELKKTMKMDYQKVWQLMKNLQKL